MDMYKEAAMLKLRIRTSAGNLTVETFNDLKLESMAAVIKDLKSQLKKDNDDDLSFLDETSKPVDRRIELAFEIAKDIYLTKKAAKEEATKTSEKKKHNKMIDEMIAFKQEESLQSKTVEELVAMRM